MLLLQLGLSFFYINGMRVWFNYGPLFLSYLPSANLSADIQPMNVNAGDDTNDRDVEYVNPDIFRSYSASITDTINPILNLIVKVGRCKSNLMTIKVVVILLVVGWMGQCLDAMSFSLIGWVCAFLLPNFYFTNKDLIDYYCHSLTQQVLRANQALTASLGGDKSKTN